MINSLQIKKFLPIIIILVIALALLVYHVISGRMSLDQSTEFLRHDSSISDVQVKPAPEGQKTVSIKCQDGSTYQVYFPPGTTDYEALVNSKCQQ